MTIVVTTIISTTMRDQVRAAIANGETPTAIANNARAQVSDQHRDFAYKGKTYTATDTIVDDEAAMNEMLAAFPEAELIGAWDFDTGALVAGGNHPNHIHLMPDVVTYSQGDIDTPPVETGRTRPAQVSDVHLYAGQAPRIFS